MKDVEELNKLEKKEFLNSFSFVSHNRDKIIHHIVSTHTRSEVPTYFMTIDQLLPIKDDQITDRLSDETPEILEV